MTTTPTPVDSPRRAPRPLVAGFVVAANICFLLGAAYLLLPRGDLPGFLPHARNALDSESSTDVPMGVVLLGLGGALLYCGRYARTHRSWLRPRSWHRKHGRL